MKREDYIHASTRVRLLEKLLLPMSTLKRIAQATDFEEAFRQFKETSYARFFSSQDTSPLKVLQLAQAQLYKDLQDIAPHCPINRFIAQPFLYHNLKVLLREHYGQFNGRDLLIPVQDFDEAYYRGIIEYPSKNPRQTDQEKALVQAMMAYDATHRAQDIDMVMDRALGETLKRLAGESDVPVLQAYVLDRLDFDNFSILLRAKRQGLDGRQFLRLLSASGHVPYEIWVSLLTASKEEAMKSLQTNGASQALCLAAKRFYENQDLSQLEKSRDDHGIRQALNAGKITYGPEVIFAFATRRSTEIQNLRMILLALQNHIDSARVLERLRDIDG